MLALAFIVAARSLVQGFFTLPIVPLHSPKDQPGGVKKPFFVAWLPALLLYPTLDLTKAHPLVERDQEGLLAGSDLENVQPVPIHVLDQHRQQLSCQAVAMQDLGIIQARRRDERIYLGPAPPCSR